MQYATKYQEEASRTCASLGSMELDLSHMILGINSEFNELQDAILNKDYVNIGEECADKIWYIANYCRFRNMEAITSLFVSAEATAKTINVSEKTIPSLLIQLAKYESILADDVKKFIAYGRKIDSESERKTLHIILSLLFSVCKIYNLSLEEMMIRNIDKLKARFPEKFSREQALNRDLDTERKILEGDK